MMNFSGHLKIWQRSLKLVLMTAFGFSLAGCVVTVVPGGSGGTTTTTISNLSYTSNYQDNQGQSLICDNTTTSLTYTFQYSGQLSSWTSSLVGVNTGQTTRTTNFYLSGPSVVASGNFVTVTYSVPSGTAPLSSTPSKPQSIIVSPAIKGYTDLLITFYDNFGNSGSVKLNQGIPVVTC